MVNELISELSKRGADLIKIVDISMLAEKENRGYEAAILIGISLSPEFISGFTEGQIELPKEFWEKEHYVQELAEWAQDFVLAKGDKAFAQSDRNINQPELYDAATRTSVLPHKAIALLAGLGWIGKHNLLITPEFGSALCMCTVCKDICPTSVIHGTTWKPGMHRDLIVDVHHCQCCLIFKVILIH